jgi:hypothetical protein
MTTTTASMIDYVRGQTRPALTADSQCPAAPKASAPRSTRHWCSG